MRARVGLWVAAGLAVIALVAVGITKYSSRMLGSAPVDTRSGSSDTPLVKATPDPAAKKITFEDAIRTIRTDQQLFAEDGVVLLGDSMVARSGVYELCGQPVLLAGIPGARVRDWIDMGPDTFAFARPRMVVFALGINDSVAEFNTDPDKWEADYLSLAKSARPARLVFLSIMPVDRSFARAGQIDDAMRDTLNARLKAIAQATGGTLIDPLPSAAGLTVDGIHMNDLGQRKWAQQLTAACAAMDAPGAETEAAQ